ncbi:hypothetical protein TRAPUB_7829 [Trametes pubescens]|uniref:Uncharacterized protein n=1 Tax=Trametes pubescens TaxID=154538 RepID=A0A1M2V2F8_TRAPU|nr:hypothetical protein TRAPUB_7829 [Trametes pubescens]
MAPYVLSIAGSLGRAARGFAGAAAAAGSVVSRRPMSDIVQVQWAAAGTVKARKKGGHDGRSPHQALLIVAMCLSRDDGSSGDQRSTCTPLPIAPSLHQNGAVAHRYRYPLQAEVFSGLILSREACQAVSGDLHSPDGSEKL